MLRRPSRVLFASFRRSLPKRGARILGCVAGAMLLAGAPFARPAAPSEAQPGGLDTKRAGLGQRCPAVDIDRLPPLKAKAMEEARVAVCTTFASDEFARRLKGASLRLTCTDQKPIGGPELLYLLKSRIPDYWVIAGKPWRAEAATNPATRRIKIRNLRFDQWNAGGPDRSAMINTLAHEWTHLILDEQGNGLIEDAGHDSRTCADGELVSYRIGDLAEAVWSAGNER